MSTPNTSATTGAAAEIAQLAAKLDLVEIDTHEAIDAIAQDMLLTSYAYPTSIKPTLTAAELANNAKIRGVYKEWNNGTEWTDDQQKVLSIMLLGMPGQGKTTAFKEAAKKYAKAMKLNYVENPPDDYRVTASDFLFVTQEFSAENSKISLTGIPTKEYDEVDEMTYMSQLINKRLASMKKAGGSMLLLDDFPNASPNIQNVGLSLTEEKRFQGLNLQGAYVGITGNLGSLDGTHTGRLSTALRNRTETYFTQDKLGNFLNRERAKYNNDDIGMAGLDGFLERFEQYFVQMPNTKTSGGFCSSRSWSAAIVETRRAIIRKGGNALAALPEINRKVASLLGKEVGQALGSYFDSLMRSADPLAKAVIMEGKMDVEGIKKRFQEGFSAEQQHFAYQYTLALSDYTVRKIVKDGGDMKEAMARFATGVMPLDTSMFSFSLDNLKGKLANAIQDEGFSVAQGANGRGLTTATKQKIVTIVAATKGFTVEHRETMIDSLTDADKHDATSKLRKRRTNGG